MYQCRICEQPVSKCNLILYFLLQENNISFYTHVEENSGMGIMEYLVSTNVAAEAGVEIQKSAKQVVGDKSMCFIH